MRPITYKGFIAPRIWIFFHGGSRDGAHSNCKKDWKYYLQNECLYSWTMKCDTGSRVHSLFRYSDEDYPYWDDDAVTYVQPAMHADVWNDILDAHDGGTLKISVKLRFWQHKFFYHILEDLQRKDMKTFANTEKAEEIMKSARREGNSKKIKYEVIHRIVEDIPARIEDYEVVEAADGGAPTVKIFIHLRVREELSEEANIDKFTALWVACDYTKVNQHGEDRKEEMWIKKAHGDPILPIEERLRTWELNLYEFFRNYTDLKRGEQILKAIVKTAKAQESKGRAAVVKTARDEIDKLMITANHWGQRRESKADDDTEFQVQMRHLFGAIHLWRWRASPVWLARLAHKKWDRMDETEHDYSLYEKTVQGLHMGVGHCEEHSRAAYFVLQGLHHGGLGKMLGRIMLTGYANIDHAFVVGGVDPLEVIKTTVHSEANKNGDPGDDTQVWNLDFALASNPDDDGYVCDPYLARFEIPQTASKLLAFIDSPKRGRKQTPYLFYRDVYPPSPVLSERTVPELKNI